MRAAIYNPYLDTLGGGERYTMSFAQTLITLGYDVDIEWSSKTISPRKFWQPEISVNKKIPTKLNLETFKKRYGIDLRGVKFVDDIKRGDGYDLCFWISDGSIPLLHARRNILHFQIPFKGTNGNSLLNKMKLFRVNKIVCNSYFTKKLIDEEYGVSSIVLYPPVDVKNIKPKRKENIILNVSRFSNLTQSKRQDVLVDSFIKLCRRGLVSWKLVLAGGVEVGAGDLVDKLTKKAKGYPIEIYKSPDFRKIKELYGKSKIYWSASGYGVDDRKNPQRVEHFGINIVEAMAAKAIPIIYEAGGHKEIVANGINGFLWKDKTNLLQITRKLIENPDFAKNISVKAKEDAQRFGYERFKKEVVQTFS